MPIGITYNAGDLILQSVSSSGNTFLENKIAAATSSLILFNVSGNLTSQSLNDTTVGTSSYLSGSNIIVSSITASNISASGYISASTFVGSHTGSLFGTSSWATNALTASSLVASNSYTITNLTASNISASATGSFGNIGIGTSTPSQKLTVSGTGTVVGRIESTSNAGARDAQLQLYVNNSGGGDPAGSILFNASASGGEISYGKIVVANTVAASAGNGEMQFWTSLGGIATERMRINKDGRVGIGITSPVNRLDVAGNISCSVITASNFFGTSSWATNALTASNLISGNSYTMRNLVASGTGSFNRVGIVTSNPLATLDVAGDARFTGNVGIGGLAAYLLDVSGSSRHGYGSADTHQFTGSVSISGSLNATSSWATNALTASYVTSSNVVGTVTSASYSLSSSFAPTTITASWATNALTASSLVVGNSYNITNLTASNIGVSNAIINGNLTVTGSIFASLFSASSIYITSSTLTVTDNIITINALNPYQRYAGLEMYDSGSGTLSSFLWDSLNNYFFISSSDANASRRVILGPIGEAGLTENYIPLISGSDNITSSVIYQSSGLIGIGLINPVNKLDVSGNISCSVITASTFFGTSSVSTNSLTASSLVAANSYTITNLTASNIRSNGTLHVNLGTIDCAVTGATLFASANAITIGNENVTTTFPGKLSVTDTTSLNSTLTVIGATVLNNTLSASGVVTASNIYGAGTLTVVGVSTLGTVSASIFVGSLTGSNFGTSSWATNSLTASSLVAANSYTITNLTASNISASSATGSFGMVGIGTTRPVALLSVVPSGSAFDNTNAMVAYFGKNTTSSYGSTFIRVAISHNTITTGSANAATDIEQNSGGSGPFRYGTYVDTNIINSQTATNGVYGSINFVTSGSARMTIAGGTSAGNVGIGTVSPDASLYVKRNSSGHVFRAASNLPTAALMGSFERQNGSGIVTGATRFGFTNNTSEIQSLLGFAFFINGTSDLNSNANGTQSLTILSTSGNVGIGTTNPAYLLDVSGSSRHGYGSADTHQFTGSVSISGSLSATSSWATNALTASYVTSSNIVGTVTSASYSLSSSFAPTTITASWATNVLTASSLVASNSYTITNLTASNISASATGSFGMVGIGTTSPVTKLHIVDIQNAESLITLRNNRQDLGNVPIFGMSAQNNTIDVAKISFYRGSGGSSGYLTFSTKFDNSASLTEKVRIDGSGNVGIGTTSPAYLLDVSGSGRYGYRASDTHQFTGSVSISGSLNATSSWATNALTASSLVASNSYTITNLTAANISASETGSFGNIGIGTSTPSQKLTVSGTGTVVGRIESTSNAGARDAQLQLYVNNSGGGDPAGSILFNASASGGEISYGKIVVANTVAASAGNGEMQFWTSLGGTATERMRINKDGRVGIGITSPVNRLDVAGNISCSVITASNFFGTSSWSTNALTASSLISDNSYTITNLTTSNQIIYKNSVLLDYSSSVIATSQSNYVVLQNFTGSFNSAFFDYFASSASNFRAGTMIVAWSGSNITYTEYATTDIGITNQLTMSVGISASYIQLLGNASSSLNWNVKSSGKYL